MKIPEIKRLVESYSIEELQKAEQQIENGEPLHIPIEGEDEGEQLTHASAAIWIHEQLVAGKTINEAVRDFSQKVRNSIS
jgi:hypothetical protein